jgi:uncharacterized membrane protein (DUF2068 family)
MGASGFLLLAFIQQGMAIPVNPAGHRVPQAIDARASDAGLRAVAGFEALKGLLVLVLLVTLIAVHNRIEDYVEDLLYHLHIDFDHRFAQGILRAASTLNGSRLWTLGLAATVYAFVRFVEAWGLWHRRVWAEWFALLSGALYLPYELLKVGERATWEHIGVLAINICIVAYMLYIRIREMRNKESA